MCVRVRACVCVCVCVCKCVCVCGMCVRVPKCMYKCTQVFPGNIHHTHSKLAHQQNNIEDDEEDFGDVTHDVDFGTAECPSHLELL